MSAAIRINLLDWRREARQAKQQRFAALLAAVVVITVILVGVLPLAYYDHALAGQRARNAYLQSQISQADARLAEIKSLKADREALVKRMNIIAELQQSRGAIVHFFDQLAATLPKGVTLTAVREADGTTTIDGLAESNAGVSEYMTALDRSRWFSDPRLVVIKRAEADTGARSDFTLQVDSLKVEAPTMRPAAIDRTTGGGPS